MEVDERLLVGIFVGGKSRRMGEPKGLLHAPDSSGRTLVERISEEVEEALPGGAVVLVGQRAEYASLPQQALADAAEDSGPLAGLVSLLREGARRGCARVLVLACDLPFVDAALIKRLVTFQATGPIVAAHFDGRYQPLFAVYSVEVLPTFEEALKKKKLALQPLLREFAAELLELSEKEVAKLQDWDSPEDVAGGTSTSSP